MLCLLFNLCNCKELRPEGVHKYGHTGIAILESDAMTIATTKVFGKIKTFSTFFPSISDFNIQKRKLIASQR